MEEVGLIHESTYNMDAFVATASCCFLQSGLYIAVIVEVILKLIIDASSTQLYMLYMLGWRNSPANFVEEVGLIHKSTFNDTFGACFTKRKFTLQFPALPFWNW